MKAPLFKEVICFLLLCSIMIPPGTASPEEQCKTSSPDVMDTINTFCREEGFVVPSKYAQLVTTICLSTSPDNQGQLLTDS